MFQLQYNYNYIIVIVIDLNYNTIVIVSEPISDYYHKISYELLKQ